MDGRELNDLLKALEDIDSKLNYLGMSKEVRKIALDDKLASAEELAVMSEIEVCDLVTQNYQLVYVYAEDEEIGLVRKDKAKELFNMIKVISR